MSRPVSRLLLALLAGAAAAGAGPAAARDWAAERDPRATPVDEGREVA